MLNNVFLVIYHLFEHNDRICELILYRLIKLLNRLTEHCYFQRQIVFVITPW